MRSSHPASAPQQLFARVPSPASHGHDKKLQLTLEASQSGGAVVLHCRGRIITRTQACALSNIVADVLPSAGRMVVDMAGVESVDNVGLGEIVLTQMWAEAAGYSLKLASLNKSVQHLFEVTNLVSVFDIYASVPDAMSAMGHEERFSA
jgi:anti-anti-sigma factor